MLYLHSPNSWPVYGKEKWKWQSVQFSVGLGITWYSRDINVIGLLDSQTEIEKIENFGNEEKLRKRDL